MKKLDFHDRRYLEAALGWLGLGNWYEANEELEHISPEMRAHPDVLNVRCKIYCAAEKWDYVTTIADTLCRMLPRSSFGPLHLAHALRQLERVSEARDVLLPLADKFPDEWRLHYQLACYCSRLGQRKDALNWLELAIDKAGRLDIRAKALDEPDLEMLWVDISQI